MGSKITYDFFNQRGLTLLLVEIQREIRTVLPACAATSVLFFFIGKAVKCPVFSYMSKESEGSIFHNRDRRKN